MRPIVRRIRAVLSLAAAWGAVTGAIGLVIGLGTGVQRSPYPVLPDVGQWWFEWHDVVIGHATSWAAGGALIALAFAAVLRRAERGRATDTLSPARFALWGALAGGGTFAAWWLAVTPLRGRGLDSVGFSLLSLSTAIVVGAGCAWLTLHLARRLTRRLTRRVARRSDPDARSAGLGDGVSMPHDALQPGAPSAARSRPGIRFEAT